MVELIHPPDPQLLLPPILACLPTAFASPRPPPALLSLLSPILRQRLGYISSSDNWLKLLCWDSSKSDALWEQVEEATFEPHPSSGEIEVGDVSSIKYKRFDEETLRAQLSLSEWPFTPIFLWCPNSDSDSGWQLAELLPSPNLDPSWSESISHANDSAKERIMTEALRAAESQPQPTQQRATSTLSVPKEEDDYWAQYDQSPGRTPARKPSVPLDQHPSQSNEADYYARYTSVQPAMDNHDPDEEMADGEQIESTLNGHAHQHQQAQHPLSKTYSPSLPQQEEQSQKEVLHPLPSNPSPPSDSSSAVISHLESAAEHYNNPATVTATNDNNKINNNHHESPSEIGIRQHVSTSIKSLYRLAASVGISGSDFRDMLDREVEGLRILEMDGDGDGP